MPKKTTEKNALCLEEIINDTLNGDALKNALEFAEYLKANEMIYTGNHCEVHYKGNCACYIYFDELCKLHGPWTVWTEGDYVGEHDDVPMDDGMKEIAWANVWRCLNCGNPCSPGKSSIIFGRRFDNVCNAVMAFRNPGRETLECVKKLVEMRKNDILKTLSV